MEGLAYVHQLLVNLLTHILLSSTYMCKCAKRIEEEVTEIEVTLVPTPY